MEKHELCLVPFLFIYLIILSVLYVKQKDENYSIKLLI